MTSVIITRTLVSGLLRLTAYLPLPVVHSMAVLLGYLLWLIPNSTRRIATINVSLCLPDWSTAARQRLLRRNLVETSKGLLELGPIWYGGKKRLNDLIQEAKAYELLSAALTQGHGVILITPHLGSWELAGLYYSDQFPITILYRSNRLGLDPLLCAGRGRFGARLVTTDRRGVRSLFQALNENTLLGVLPDQDPGRDKGLFAPFFGLSANTMTLVARLAIRTGAPVFLTYAERLSRGKGFKIHLQPLPSMTHETTLENVLVAMNVAIEEAVRRLPEQYLWGYKRFKTRPPGIPKIY